VNTGYHIPGRWTSSAGWSATQPPFRPLPPDKAKATQRKTIILAIGRSLAAAFVLLLVLGVILSVVGPETGTTSAKPSTLPSESVKKSPSASKSPSPTPTVDKDAKKKALIEKAERVAAAELPDAPLWKGATFKGTWVSASSVCVDRAFKNGDNAGFVVVAFPEGKD